MRPDLGEFSAAAKSLQSCPTLCDPTDSSPPGSAVPGILQARTLECARPLPVPCPAPHPGQWHSLASVGFAWAVVISQSLNERSPPGLRRDYFKGI